MEEDAEAFLELNSDPRVLRFVPDGPLLDVEQTRRILIDHTMADYCKHGFGRSACILKTTGQQIGFAGLKFLEELGEVDLAYRLLLRLRHARSQANHRPGHAREHRIDPGAGKSRTALHGRGVLLGTPLFKVYDHFRIRSKY